MPTFTGLSGSQVVAFVLLDVALILVAARACGALARKVGQPAVVGEIIAGVLLGPTLLGPSVFVWETPWSFLSCDSALEAFGKTASISSCLFPPQAQSVLGSLGQLALLLFMFLVGLELDYSQLSGKGRPIGIVAGGVVAVPVVVGLLLHPVMFTDTFVGDAAPSALAFDLFVGATISITALPVMVRILQEKGLATTMLGTVGIAAAAAVTVLMFMLVAVASGIAAGAGTAALTIKLLLAVGYLAVMFLVVRPALEPLGRRYEARAREVAARHRSQGWSGTDEFAPAGVGWTLTHGMFAWIIVLLLVSGLVAHLLGINVIVGGFVAGAVLPAREGLIRDMTAELFDVVVIVLLPIFLAFAGLNTDFSALSVAAVPGIVVFILACVAAKVASGAAFGRLAGLSWAEGSALGILMNCRGLLPLVVALIGFQQGVISGALQVAIVVMALITTAMTGPLFDRFQPSASRTPAVPAA